MGGQTAAAIAGLGALAVAMGVGRFAFTPLLPLMQEDAGVSLAQGGYLASANYFGYLAGALWAARPARARVAIPAALLAIAATTLAMGFAHGMTAWLLLRFLAGVASAWALVHVSSWCLERLAPSGRPILAGVLFSGVGVGILLAGGVCLALMSAGAGSSRTWIVLGLASLLVTAAVWPILGSDDGRRTPRQERAAYVWTGDALRLVLCYGAFGFGYIIPATFVPVMAKRIVEDPAVFGWAWPMLGLAAAASTLAAAAWLPRLGNRRLWSLAAFAMAGGVAAPIFIPGIAGVGAAAVLVGGTFMVITMAGMQEARRIGGVHAAALMAAMTASFAAGQIAGPLLVSYLVQAQGGFSATLAAASALLVLSAVALVSKEKPCPT